MAELIALIGAASSVVSLVDGACKFVNQIKETRRLLQQQTGLEQVDDELASLAELVSQLQSDLEAGSVDESDISTVGKSVALCARTVEELRTLLQKVSTHHGDSRRIQTGKFLLSIAKAKEVASLDKKLGKEKDELHRVLQNVTRKMVSKAFGKLSLANQMAVGISVSVKHVQQSVVDIHQGFKENTEELQAHFEHVRSSLDYAEETVKTSHSVIEKDSELLARVQQDIQDMPREIIQELARRPDLLRRQLELIERSSKAPNYTQNMTAFSPSVDRRPALRRYCGGRCPCSCHSQAKWSFMKGMNINSSGFQALFWQQCDTLECRPARLASFDLKFFPQSILKFALRASVVFDYGAGGFSITPALHVRRILDWDQALFVASRVGDFAKVRHLVETGQASATDSDDIGWTSMHCAADNGHLEIARYLAEQGGDVNEVTLYNESPTTLALRHIAKGSSKLGDRSACDVVQYFFDESDGIEHNASLSTMSAYADLGRIMEKSFQLNRPKLCLRKEIDFRHDYGCTVLAIAIILRDEELAMEQLEQGANPRATNQWNQTILHLASRHGFLLGELLETEAIKDLNARDDFNQSPLITAARNGSFAAVAKLLEAFPDAQHKSAGTSYNALNWAVLSGNADVAKAIAEYDASPAHLDTTGWLGRTPILDAAISGNPDVLKALLDAGCNAQICDSEGNRVLHLAGSAATTRLLLSAGFDINLPGAKARTPVMSALLAQRVDVVEFLVQAGASVALRDHNGWSTLHYALQQRPDAPEQSSLAALLKLCIRNGAHAHGVDNCMCMCSPNGCSPTTFALLNGRIKQWKQVLEDLNLPTKPMVQFIRKFRDFERLGKLHTCCQGSLFVQPYQHAHMDEAGPTPVAGKGRVESLDEDGSSKNPANRNGRESQEVEAEAQAEKDDGEEEGAEVFHDANEEPVRVESLVDVSLQKKIASMNRAGCQTVLLHRDGKRMRVDVQSLVGFKDWEVLLDV